MSEIPKLTHVAIDAVETSDIAPGIVRRGLPGGALAARAFDFAPGTTWPEPDHHATDELIYVASGELFDNGQTFPAGSFLHYHPGSVHQPGTRTGTRILVFSLPHPTPTD
ncbi:cupin domain-containing protein [Nonomuraea sp. NPDC050790]|uniref:cupin domain-containing protein n=1 Tax=Nonomuraea sp. NPDC050790 TaxID=3364371 RepID=UPI00379D3576